MFRRSLLVAAGMLAFLRAQAQVPVDGNGFFHLNSGEAPYVGYAPDTYDPAAPISLFVWMHGYGGDSEGDLWTVAPYATRATQSYIAISLGGRDGTGWDVNSDTPKVLAAIQDVSRYFNINPRKVYIGGYSSGGDMAYRVGFQYAYLFAGILAENTDPFRDTGMPGAALMAGAAWKLNVAHLAHLSDTTYPIDGVRANLAALAGNGFPVVKIERPGTHYDPDAGTTGTNYDLRTSLLPYLDAGWTSPDPSAYPRPTLRLKTPKRVVTTRPIYTIKGVVPAGSQAKVVEVQVRKGGFKPARITGTKWSFKVRLKLGRNKVAVQAVGPTGVLSKRINIVLVRKSAGG